MNEQALKDLERLLHAKYPLGVPRKHIGEATGCVLHPRTCANFDCQGEGIPGRYKIGRQMVYPVVGIIAILKSKMITDL
jgi:hypothetical protein